MIRAIVKAVTNIKIVLEIYIYIYIYMQIYANQTSTEAVVHMYAASTDLATTRVHDDVIDGVTDDAAQDVTSAVAEQQGYADCKQDIPR